MKRRKLLCLAVVLLLVRDGAWGEESDEALLARYLKRGLVPSTMAIPGYLSERDVLTGVARRLPRILYPLDANLPQKFRNALPEARLERPIAVRVFEYGTVERRDSPLYYYVVPMSHPTTDLILLMAYKRYYDRRSDTVSWSVGNWSWPGERKSKMIHLITAGEARSLVARQFGVTISRDPMAVSMFVRHLWVGGANVFGWFWYVIADSPIKSGGSSVRSVFVYPIAEVPSAEAATLDLLADRASVTDAGAVLVKDRYYTWEGTDIDLYALDAAQRAAGDVALSSSPLDVRYLPEKIRFVPLAAGETAPAGGQQQR